jgi:polysaccharide export outer membrane protein
MTMRSVHRFAPMTSQGRNLLVILSGWLGAWGLPGCAMLDNSDSLTAAPASQTSTQPTALSWLTNWVSQPIDMAPGFDVESIKPALRPVTVATDDLLEITIWDLYEPGKPYSFPVRISARQTLDAPMLGEVLIEGRTMSQIESILVDGFRKGEFLWNPRVLVRSLDAPFVKVQVTGAVNRPGFVELARSDRSVYAALLSAGGLRKSAGAQVAITRRADVHVVEPTLVGAVGELTPEPLAGATDTVGEPRQPHPPEQRANSVEGLAVPAAPPVVRPSGTTRPLFSVADEIVAAGVEPAPERPVVVLVAPQETASNSSRRANSQSAENGAQPMVWYDLARAHGRDQLKSLLLAEGDIVTVKEAAPPLRVAGAINQPGTYPLPPGRTLNVWQAIELAGGVRDAEIPLNLTLMRPASEGRGARRWYLSVADYQQHPLSSPFVEPGDVLQIEPTTGSKIKRAVGDLWSKP